MKPETLKILVIDDEIGARRSSWHKIFVEKYACLGFEFVYSDSRDADGNFSLACAEDFVRQNLDASLILLDIMFGAEDRFGVKILQRIRKFYAYIPVIMLTSVSDPEVRDTCLKLAATYLIKDTFSKEELKTEIERYAVPARDRIVGSSPVVVALRRTLAGYAQAPSQPVLITGETGTGKELAARNLHRLGPRRHGPFLALNCAQVADNLEGSELFGHVKGAFTGADKDKIGLLEAADGGTLFLDEIGTMRVSLQEKLLRVIEDGLVRRIGDTKDRKIDVRIVAATNAELSGLVAEGRFSEPLFYRLHGLALHLPSLRERLEDIPELVDYWLKFWHYREYSSDPPFSISKAALASLKKCSWPGNVRQLVQALGSAIVECYKISHDTTIRPEHLSIYLRDTRTPSGVSLPQAAEIPVLPEDESMWAHYRSLWEIRLISQALARTGENSSRTIQLLFPNIATPSDTYLKRLVYNLVDGAWGNRNILSEPRLREAFQPLAGAYQKEKELAVKEQIKNIVRKMRKKDESKLEQDGVPIQKLIAAWQKTDWESLEEMANEVKEQVQGKENLDGELSRLCLDLDAIANGANFLAAIARMKEIDG